MKHEQYYYEFRLLVCPLMDPSITHNIMVRVFSDKPAARPAIFRNYCPRTEEERKVVFDRVNELKEVRLQIRDMRQLFLIFSDAVYEYEVANDKWIIVCDESDNETEINI